MIYSPQQKREHVRSVQRQLRTVSLANPDIPAVTPDGYYDARTAEAVAAFQRHHGLPGTGETDQRTWDALQLAGQGVRFELDDAAALIPFWSAISFSGPGGWARVYLLQSLLATLCLCFSNLTAQPMSGELDEATKTNIGTIQSLAGLPKTGEVDKRTWKCLAGVYNAFATSLDTPS